MANNIALVSTCFAGIDSVSIEAHKWAQVLEKKVIAVFSLPGSWIKISPSVFMFRKPILDMIKINGSTVRCLVKNDEIQL